MTEGLRVTVFDMTVGPSIGETFKLTSTYWIRSFGPTLSGVRLDGALILGPPEGRVVMLRAVYRRAKSPPLRKTHEFFFRTNIVPPLHVSGRAKI